MELVKIGDKYVNEAPEHGWPKTTIKDCVYTIKTAEEARMLAKMNESDDGNVKMLCTQYLGSIQQAADVIYLVMQDYEPIAAFISEEEAKKIQIIDDFLIIKLQILFTRILDIGFGKQNQQAVLLIKDPKRPVSSRISGFMILKIKMVQLSVVSMIQYSLTRKEVCQILVQTI